jgi:hypothetical protein
VGQSGNEELLNEHDESSLFSLGMKIQDACKYAIKRPSGNAVGKGGAGCGINPCRKSPSGAGWASAL